MKKPFIISCALFIGSLISCQKENTDSISLTASTTSTTIGQPVSFQVTTSASAVKWTVTPSIAASKLYNITNLKSNIITFSQAGNYTIGVSARELDVDSNHVRNADSCWHSHDNDHRDCKKGVDSAAVTVVVK